MNIGVEGQKYEGKTTLAFWLACRIRDRANTYKIMIFDPKWSFRNPYVIAHGQTRHVTWAEDSVEFEYQLTQPATAVAYRPALSLEEDDSELMWTEFSRFCEAINLEGILREPPARPVVLLIDEAYCLQNGKNVHPALANAIRLATKGRVYIILAVHGPRELSPMIRRQLDEMYLFRQNDPTDLDYIRERCGPEAEKIVASLPQHHVLVYRSNARRFEVWSDPSLWRVEIGESRVTATD